MVINEDTKLLFEVSRCDNREKNACDGNISEFIFINLLRK